MLEVRNFLVGCVSTSLAFQLFVQTVFSYELPTTLTFIDNQTRTAGIDVTNVSFGQPLWIQWINGASPVNLSVWSVNTIADQPDSLVCELVHVHPIRNLRYGTCVDGSIDNLPADGDYMWTPERTTDLSQSGPWQLVITDSNGTDPSAPLNFTNAQSDSSSSSSAAGTATKFDSTVSLTSPLLEIIYLPTFP